MTDTFCSSFLKQLLQSPDLLFFLIAWVLLIYLLLFVCMPKLKLGKDLMFLIYTVHLVCIVVYYK